jgi:hypothetical protein
MFQRGITGVGISEFAESRELEVFISNEGFLTSIMFECLQPPAMRNSSTNI